MNFLVFLSAYSFVVLIVALLLTLIVSWFISKESKE